MSLIQSISPSDKSSHFNCSLNSSWNCKACRRMRPKRRQRRKVPKRKRQMMVTTNWTATNGWRTHCDSKNKDRCWPKMHRRRKTTGMAWKIRVIQSTNANAAKMANIVTEIVRRRLHHRRLVDTDVKSIRISCIIYFIKTYRLIVLYPPFTECAFQVSRCTFWQTYKIIVSFMAHALSSVS